MLALIFTILFLGAFLWFSAFFIKKFFIEKRSVSLGSQVVGENIFMQYQNEEKKNAIEQVIYQNEEENQDDEGDDLGRFLKKKRENAG